MKAKFAAVLIAIALLSTAGLAQASTKMELARQYFDLFNLEENIKAIFSSMAMKDMISAIQAADPDKKIPEAKLMEEFKIMQDAFTQSDYLKQIKEAIIEITAEVFSEDELKALISFYSSKEGKSIIKKMPVYAQKTQIKIGQMSIPLVKKIVKETVEKRKEKEQMQNKQK